MSNQFAKCIFFNARFFDCQRFNFSASNFLLHNIKPYKIINGNNLLSHFFIGLFITIIMLSNASAATLTYSDNLIIRDIDDQAVEHNLFSQKKAFKLSQGIHTIVLKYKDVFEDIDFAEDRLVKSDYFVVKFTIKNHQDLFLSTTKISNLAQAERFIKSPELMMVDNNKQELMLTLEKLSDYELAKQVTKVVTSISTPNVKKLSTEKTSKNTVLDNEFNEKVIKEVDAVPMLKYWWEKATEAQKASFLQFVDDKKVLKK